GRYGAWRVGAAVDTSPKRQRGDVPTQAPSASAGTRRPRAGAWGLCLLNPPATSFRREARREKNKASPKGEALLFQPRFAELSGEVLRLAQAGVGLFGFFEADVAVAVLVEQLELLGCAEELARRHVAVAVAVHLAEPQRARGGNPYRLHLPRNRPHIRIRVRARGQGQLELVRDLRLGNGPIVVVVVLGEPLPRAAQFADTQPAVAVGVQDLEQALTQLGDAQRHHAVGGLGLQGQVVVELLERDLAVAVVIGQVEDALQILQLRVLKFLQLDKALVLAINSAEDLLEIR